MSLPVKSIQSKEINGTFKLQPRSCLTQPAPPPMAAMCDNSQTSVDEAINNDEAIVAFGMNTSCASIPLSKKAMHQRDADENLFLRFLELDPPAQPESTPTNASQSELRRKSTHKSSSSKESTPIITANNQNGRTPFTITKKLTRTVEKGFGFSIVWTHPPRIEKIEPGLSAERCGILPGDYVIFVDKHNVVTMPEMDILNLIKSQGKTLVLEIFRRSSASRPTSNGVKSRAPSLTVSANNMNAINNVVTVNTVSTGATTSHNYNNYNNNNNNSNNNNNININQDDQTSEFATPKQSTSSLVPARPLTACSNVSLETTKRRLHLPQVTFSKEVGQGVIV